VRLKGHSPQRATFRRKTDAKKWVQDTESAIRDARYFKSSVALKLTLNELLDQYIDEVLSEQKDWRNRKRQLEWWRNQIGHLVLADITPAEVSRLKSVLSNETTKSGKKRAASTVNRYLAALSHVLSVAVKEWHCIDQNPVFSVSKLSEPRGRVRFLDEHERRSLIEACKTSDESVLYPIVLLALSTGARKGEILGLRWRNIDLDRRIAILDDTKNAEIRPLPLVGEAFDQLERLSKVRRIDTDLVFPGRTGKPIAIDKVWREALRVAGITDFRFHDLRHTAASYLAMSGATPTEIAAILGHKTLQMVKRYAHLGDSHVADVVSRMNHKFLA